MLMTQRQAVMKWCPMVRDNSVSEYGASGNTIARGSDGNGQQTWNTCIGSRCAMWRVVKQPHAIDEPAPEPIGYCGLAGDPRIWKT